MYGKRGGQLQLGFRPRSYFTRKWRRNVSIYRRFYTPFTAKAGPAMNNQDPYFKLRPPRPTPMEAFCRCPETTPIKLMSALGYNPVHCMDCNREVPPEALALSAELAEAISIWQSVYDAIDRLWLDSRAYEIWARDQLADLHSPVNVRGRTMQRELNKIRKCYYWYFQDSSEPDFKPITNCPACGKTLAKYGRRIQQLICESCLIVTSGD